MKLKGHFISGTFLFDTPDGDLSLGQWSKHPKSGYVVRRHPKNNWNTITIQKLNPDIDKEEVQIIGTAAYITYFIPLPNGQYRRYRERKHDLPQNMRGYKGNRLTTKIFTDAQIQKIIEDDKQWVDIPIGDKRQEKQMIKRGVRNGSSSL